MSMIIIISSIMIMLLTVLGDMKNPWWLSISDFFRLQYIIISLILALISLFQGLYIFSLCLFCATAYNLYRIRHYLPSKNKAGKENPKRKILSINAYHKNTAPEKLAKLIHFSEPDLLLIMEMTDRLEKNLESVLSRYPEKLESDVRDGFRISLFGVSPFKKSEISYHGPGKTPLLKVITDIDGQEYRVYSAHPKPALNKTWSIERTAYFREVRDVIAQDAKQTIMMGDFNTVPWEPWFLEFLSQTGLKSTLKDHGYKVTWPTYFLPMGIPMDHILVSEEIKYMDLKIGPHVGSDHYPISINL